MAKLYYEGLLIGEVLTNRSMTTDEAVELLEANIKEFCKRHQINESELDPNDFTLEY